MIKKEKFEQYTLGHFYLSIYLFNANRYCLFCLPPFFVVNTICRYAHSSLHPVHHILLLLFLASQLVFQSARMAHDCNGTGYTD